MNLVLRSRTWLACALMTASLGMGCGNSSSLAGESLPMSSFVSDSAEGAARAEDGSGAETAPAAEEQVLARAARLSRTSPTTPTTSTTRARNWAGVRNFGCQLQDIDFTRLRNSSFDMLVMDYSVYGDAASKFTPTQINQLKAAGKRPVAYLSVGEAEDYRYYWKRAWRPGTPYWLGPTNPEWGGNYKVQYWAQEWKNILWGSSTAYLDQILAAGYDGVFLDVVDAYEYWEGRGYSNARNEMALLVQQLGTYARQRSGQDFGIFLNGGEELARNGNVLYTLTGVAKEEIFYGFNGVNTRTPAEVTSWTQAQLAPIVRAGKLVLSIDYASVPAYRQDALTRATQAGYREYVSSSEALNNLENQ